MVIRGVKGVRYFFEFFVIISFVLNLYLRMRMGSGAAPSYDSESVVHCWLLVIFASLPGELKTAKTV